MDNEELDKWKRKMCDSITVTDKGCINKHGTVICDADNIGCNGCPYESVE